jgi:hypothetical protein
VDDDNDPPPLPSAVDSEEEDTDADGLVVFSTRRVRGAQRFAAQAASAA